MGLLAQSWRVALRQPSYRTFSISTILQRSKIPTFAPTPSNPELAALLEKARRRILIPAHLNREQHALVHEPRYGVRMRNEPIRAQVGGVEVELEHVGPHVRDTPRTYDVFRDAVRLAQTPADWNNVGLLVAGLFEVAQLKPRPETAMPDAWVERMARGDGYALDMVIRLAAGAERSGVRLRSEGVVARVLWEIRRRTAEEGWEGEATDRALARAEKVVELLESPAHCGGKQVVKGDVRTLPFVIAAPLELAAVRALMPAPAPGTSGAAAAATTEGEGETEAEAEEGVDEQLRAKAAESVAKQKQARAKVQAYAERLVANLKLYGVEEPTPVENEAGGEFKRPSRFNEAVDQLRQLIPVWRALALAQRVLGDEMPQPKVNTYRQLTRLRERIEARVAVLERIVANGRRSGNPEIVEAWYQVKSNE